MKSFGLILWVWAILMLPVQSWAVNVKAIRISDTAEKSRIVFELNRAVGYTIFRMHKPERVVIDMKHAHLLKGAIHADFSSMIIKRVRHGMHKGVLRVVIDVNHKNLPLRSFLLKKMHGKPDRLVIDLLRKKSNYKINVVNKHSHQLVIAVDAGHGGQDPGAIGSHGLQEKKVTLAIAKKLVAMINQQKGVRAILTRKNDYFVPLRKRVRLARQANADIMISIHVDAVKKRSVKGSSVYTLAERGATADKVAIALASKENSADKMVGIHHQHFEIADPMLRNILGDMAKRDSLNSSQILAENIIESLKSLGNIKYDAPKRARFVVLGALEIPSVLVEVDFISNPRQERKLRTSSYQRQIAKAIFQGSQHFLQRMGMLVKTHDKKAS
ncbi:MAG: N-acetylmuramoyl-L-alanine amidase [Mariprofundaceae bacterium]|nr:N-acetylmuramoyl-L-alanine amidase [Mariprofundaceae bacterium]